MGSSSRPARAAAVGVRHPPSPAAAVGSGSRGSLSSRSGVRHRPSPEQPQWGQAPAQPEQPQWGQAPAQPQGPSSRSGVRHRPSLSSPWRVAGSSRRPGPGVRRYHPDPSRRVLRRVHRWVRPTCFRPPKRWTPSPACRCRRLIRVPRPPASGSRPSSLATLLIGVLILGLLWFFLFRPSSDGATGSTGPVEVTATFTGTVDPACADLGAALTADDLSTTVVSRLNDVAIAKDLEENKAYFEQLAKDIAPLMDQYQSACVAAVSAGNAPEFYRTFVDTFEASVTDGATVATTALDSGGQVRRRMLTGCGQRPANSRPVPLR